MGTIKLTKGTTAFVTMVKPANTDSIDLPIHLDGGGAGKVTVTDETGVTGNTRQVCILPLH